MAENKHLDHGGMCLRSIVDELMPEHIRSSKPKLVSLLKSFADYLEHEHKSGYFVNRIQDQRNIDTIDEQFFLAIQKEIGAPIPQTFATDPRLFYKQITDLYTSRGTPDSIKAFFKLLFNDEVEIAFPVTEMLIPSDGRWYTYADKIAADRTKYDPIFIYTLTEPTTTITGPDDDGSRLVVDQPIIYAGVSIDVDGQYIGGSVRDDYTMTFTPNSTTGKTDISIEFEDTLPPGLVLIYSEGIFTTNDSFLSSYPKLQDSFYYQKFSYVLKTGTDVSLWRDAFTRLIHPSGFIFFGEVVLFLNGITGTPPLEQPGLQRGGLPIPIFVPVVKGNSVSRVDDYEREIVIHLRDRKSRFSAEQQLEIIKFSMETPIEAFEEYTVQDAINKTIDIHIGAEIDASQYTSIPSWMQN